MSLLESLKETLKGNFADKQVKEKRMDACSACKHLLLGSNCEKCLCFVAWKTSIKNEKCPIGKW